MQTKHTPTPWIKGEHEWLYGSNGKEVDISRSAGIGVANTNEAKANAAFIVRACNSHEALVEALEVLLRRYTFHDQDEERALAALTLAKGEA